MTIFKFASIIFRAQPFVGIGNPTYAKMPSICDEPSLKDVRKECARAQDEEGKES